MERYIDDDRIILTLDAGGTHFLFSAIRSGREIVNPVRKKSDVLNLEHCIMQIKEGFHSVIAQLHHAPSAISFAFPGPADYGNGIIGDLPNFPAFRGGVALGPKPRSYRVDLNKKVKRVAMKSALSSKVADEALVVVDAITATEYKTRTMVKMLSDVGAAGKALVVLPAKDEMTTKSFANIPGVKTAYVNTLNVYDILNCDKLVVALDAVKKIEEVYA